MSKPTREVPERLKKAGLTEEQCRAAYVYWMSRIDLARLQRNILIGAIMVLVSTFFVRNFLFDPVSPPGGNSNSFESVSDFLVTRGGPIVLILCGLSMAVIQGAVIKLNKELDDPTYNLQMTQHSLAVVKRIGNSAAIATIMFRKIPHYS